MYIQTLPSPLFLEQGTTVKAVWQNQDAFPLKHLSLILVHKNGNEVKNALEITHKLC